MERGFLIALLVIAMSGLAWHQGIQNTHQPQQAPLAPVGKLTPIPQKTTTSPKLPPCSQRLKAQVSLNDDLKIRVGRLEAENQSLHKLNDNLVTGWQEASTRNEQMVQERDQTIEKQRKLLEQYSSVSKALAAEMLASELSGNWTVQTPYGQVVCYVKAYEVSHTIQLTNCTK